MPDNNFIPWDDIVASPKFQGLEPAQKRKVMNVWVKENLNTSEKFNALDAGRQTHIIKSLEHQAGLSVAGYTPQKQTQVTGLTIGDIGRASEDVAMGKPVVAGERNREAIKTVEEQPEATWGEIFKSIPESAVNQTAQGFGGIAQAIGEGLKLPKVAQWGRDVYQGTEQIQQELTPNIKSGLKGNVYGAGVSVLQNLMTLPLSIITGSPAPTLAIMGMTAGGQGYGEAREKGLDVGKSLAYGTSMGGSEVVTEWSPMSTLLKPGISLGKRLFTEALQEVFGENVNTVHQHITKQLAFNPNATVGDFLNSLPQQIKDTTYQTLLSSPLLAGASHLVVGGENGPKPLYDTPKDFTGEPIQPEGEAPANKGLQLRKPEVDLPPGYTPSVPTTEEKPFTPEEDIKAEGETPNKGLDITPQRLPEAPKLEDTTQETSEQPQEQNDLEKPPGFLPLEKAWGSTREEELAEWDKAVGYIEGVGKQLQPQIDELQDRLKAIKGKSPVKQKLQQQIKFLKDKITAARNEYDEAAAERSLVIAEQAKQRLAEQGFADEETIQYIVDDFLTSSGLTLNPSLHISNFEVNQKKTLEQLLEEAVQRKLQSDLAKEEKGDIRDGEGVQGGDEGREGLGVSQEVQRGEEVANEEVDVKLLPNKAGTFSPSKPTLPTGLKIEKEEIVSQEEPTKDIVPSPEETVHAQEGTSQSGKEPSSGGVAPVISKKPTKIPTIKDGRSDKKALKVVDGLLLSRAIEKAVRNLQANGAEKTQEEIDRHVKEFGASPSAIKHGKTKELGDNEKEVEKPSTKVYTSKKKGGGKNVRVEKPGADSQVEGSEKLEGDVPEPPTEERPNTVPQAGEHGDSGSGDQRSGGAGVEPSVTGNTGVDAAGKDEGAGGGDSEGVGAGGTSERTGRERGLNYRINTQDDLGGGTPKKAFGDNVEAVKLLKKIESENRKATADEQKILAKYVGWGGMPGAFRGYGDWRNEYDVLKNLLTEQEWDEAKGSTLNAHYTSAEVIKNIYHFVEKMGFKGGYILEPSAGIGNFIGLLPENIAKNSISKVTGIELDSISGRIAKQLYQDANIVISGFENVTLPDNFYDLAISNVPFGDYKLYDARYNRYGFNIHDYFFAKSIDKVKPGGLLVFITSRFTMDKKDQKVRKYLSDKADFIGAIRLPYTAFKDNANTEVVTDIVILRKKDAGSDSVQRKEWLGTVEQPLMKYDKYYGKDIAAGTFHLNEYYVKNSDMMFGRMMGEGSMYRPAEPTLVPLAGGSLSESFAKAESKIPANIMSSTQNTTTTTPVVSAPTQRKRGTYYVQGGKIFMNDQEVEVKPIIANRIKGMIAVRDAANTLLSKESETNEDGEIAPEMKHLNAAYDSFVKKYGYIHSKANVSALKGDVEFPRLLALEKYDSDKGVVVGKADIFTKRLISKESVNVKADSSIDALAISLAETGKVDLGRMSKLTGKSIADLQEELLGEIFLNPEGGKWESAEEYLSGNVVAKLEAAEAAVKIDAKYRFNVESLKKVQPEPLTERDIIPKLGASWVDGSDIEAFIKEILNTTEYIKVSHSPEIGFWAVETQKYELRYNTANTNEWGISEYTAIQLIDDALNGKTPTILKKINVGGEVQVVVDTEKTEAAKDKQNKIKEKFKDWLWADSERTERLLKRYNRERNNLRERSYTAPKFTFPGMSAVWKAKLNKHQLNAIWRVIQSPTTLLAHTVGAGKTATMVAAAMELKRLGIIRKPMFAVPKHLIEQFAAEFLNIYPHARILTAGAEDFTPKNRGVLMSNISTNDWDAVVVGHTSFGKLPISQKHINDFIKEQIEAIEFAIEALGGSKQKGNRVVKQLQAAKKRLEFKVKEVGDKQDNVINFEELGVDQIFIDEAHKFKNLYMATKMTRVAGVPATESQRSFDMYVKTQYLINKYGRGVVFATGTPISNSMSELFTMQRYLQSKTLKENGLHHFDTWAGDYGNIVTSWEVSPDGGGFRTRTRFAQFINVPELISVFKQVADIQTAKMLKLPKPDLKGGRAVTISAEASPELKEYVTELVKRSEEIRSGKVDKRVDNMLKVTTDGMKAALDMRLVNPALPDNPSSKVNMSVNNIIDIWNRTKPDRSTQLLFIDRSVPQEGVFNVYDDIIAKLKQGGIPKDEIAVIHDYDTDEAKTVLFGKVRSGSVRVLLGSTAKMGEGMNVQDKLIALHHLDAPWKPTDIEQREGRILRRGNKNKEVEIYNYITKGSFDAYMWQVLEVKARFIAQIMTGDAVARSVNDVDDTSLTYAEVKALASANPLTLEKLKADKELLRLERLKAQHNNEQYDIQRELGSLPAKVQGLRNKIKKIDADIKQRNIPEEFSITIKGKVYTDRKEAGQVILGIAKKLKADEEISEAIGEYAGLEMHIKKHFLGLAYLEIGNAYPLKSEVSDSDAGTITRLDNTAKSFEKEKEYIENELAVSTKRLADLEGLKGKTFEYETELLKAMKHVQDLTSKLDLDKSDANSGDDDGPDDGGGGGLSGDADLGGYAQEHPDHMAAIKQSLITGNIDMGVPVSALRVAGKLLGIAIKQGTNKDLAWDKLIKSLANERGYAMLRGDKPKTIEEQLAPLTPNYSGGDADIGGYADDVEDEDAFRPIEGPELIELYKAINDGKYPIVMRKLRAMAGRAVGYAKYVGDKADILLSANIFTDAKNAVKVLSHEIGHIIDWLPDKTHSRGNIFGHLLSLKKYLKHTIDSLPGVKKQHIMRELKALSFKWKPLSKVDKARAGINKSYMDYRMRPSELYADATSVLFNNPKMFKKYAPKAFELFLKGLDSKPLVKQSYEDIQKRIKEGPEAVALGRQKQTLEGFSRAEADLAQPIKEMESVTFADKWRKFVDGFKKELVDRHSPLYSSIADDTIRQNVRNAVEEFLYYSAEGEAYFKEVENKTITPFLVSGITEQQVGEYMKMQRIIHERQKIANPNMHNVKTAEDALETLRRQIGDELYNKMEEFVDGFWQIRKTYIVTRLKQSGMYTDELMEKIEANEKYATFAVGDYITPEIKKGYGSGITGKIFKQVGTVKEIMNPFTATIMKDLTLIRSVVRNNAVKSSVKALLNHREDFVDFRPADTELRRVPGGKVVRVPKELPEGSELKLLTYMEKGKVIGYYVPSDIADAFEVNPIEADTITKFLSALNKPFKELLTRKNPGFWPFNLTKDMFSAVKLLPKASLHEFIPMMLGSVGDAWRGTMGYDELTQDLLRGKALIATINRDAKSEDTQLERLRRRYGYTDTSLGLRHKIRKFLDYLNIGGELSERITKIAAYKYLNKHFPDMSHSDKMHLIRWVGSPAFLVKGEHTPWVNNILLFFNPMVQGTRIHLETAKKRPLDYWWKTTKYNILPKVVMMTASYGLIDAVLRNVFRMRDDDDWIKKMFDRVSSYDLTNYITIPFGWSQNKFVKKLMYLRIPQDEFGRVVGGVVNKVGDIAYNAITNKDKPANIMELVSLLDYGIGQFPSVSPPLSAISSTIQFLATGNTYDTFTGRFAIPKGVADAKDDRALKYFAEYLANKLGVGIVHRFDVHDIGQEKTFVEKVFESPVSSNTLGRWVKVGETGIYEKLNEPVEEARIDKARDILNVREAMLNIINQVPYEKWDERQKDSFLRYQLTHTQKELFGKLNEYMTKKSANALAIALTNAHTKEEKIKVIQKADELRLLE